MIAESAGSFPSGLDKGEEAPQPADELQEPDPMPEAPSPLKEREPRVEQPRVAQDEAVQDKALTVPVPDSEDETLVAQRNKSVALLAFVARRQEHVAQNRASQKKAIEINLRRMWPKHHSEFRKAQAKEWASWLKYDTVEFLTQRSRRELLRTRCCGCGI